MTTERPARADAPGVSLAGLFLAFFRLGATAYGGPAMMASLPHYDRIKRLREFGRASLVASLRPPRWRSGGRSISC